MATSSKQILVLDDDEDILRVVKRTLRGYDVQGVARPLDALEVLRERSFDLVMCDVRMPDMNGIEFFQRASTEFPRINGRFLFTTGGVSEEDEAIATGQPVLRKPYTPKQLREAVGSFIEEGKR